MPKARKGQIHKSAKRQKPSQAALDRAERLYWLGQPVDADGRLVGTDKTRRRRRVTW